MFVRQLHNVRCLQKLIFTLGNLIQNWLDDSFLDDTVWTTNFWTTDPIGRQAVWPTSCLADRHDSTTGHLADKLFGQQMFWTTSFLADRPDWTKKIWPTDPIGRQIFGRQAFWMAIRFLNGKLRHEQRFGQLSFNDKHDLQCG